MGASHRCAHIYIYEVISEIFNIISGILQIFFFKYALDVYYTSRSYTVLPQRVVATAVKSYTRFK